MYSTQVVSSFSGIITLKAGLVGGNLSSTRLFNLRMLTFSLRPFGRADQWIDYLSGCNLITEAQDSTQEDGGRKRTYYVKTETGQIWHDALKSHDRVGPLLNDLSRMKRRRS
ncbi:MAG: hypothetical protein ACRECH_17925 [Nitrososphaerales archaeon]